MEVNREIVMNTILDWRKKKIDPFIKAELMLRLMKELKCKSYRELARRLEMPPSVVQDWIRWADVDKKEYNKMRNRGIKHSEIYRQLRKNIGKVDRIITKIKLDIELEEFTTYLRKNILYPNYSSKTTNLIKYCINKLNRVWSKIELEQKKNQNGK